jgi:hypothetical protein
VDGSENDELRITDEEWQQAILRSSESLAKIAKGTVFEEAAQRCYEEAVRRADISSPPPESP